MVLTLLDVASTPPQFQDGDTDGTQRPGRPSKMDTHTDRSRTMGARFGHEDEGRGEAWKAAKARRPCPWAAGATGRVAGRSYRVGGGEVWRVAHGV